MKIFKPFKLSLLTKCFEMSRKSFFSVSILGFFPFDRPELLPEMAMWKLVPEELGTAVLDECMPKQKAEVLICGSAFPQGEEPQTTCPIRVKLGSLEKRLNVIGDRFWKNDQQTAPQPFTEMPVTWENAFGGPKLDTNPVGKGHRPVETEHGAVQFLPNIELPAQMITSPSQKPEPVGFMPFDLSWPQRLSKAGTYDQSWLKELFPGYARDLDWAFFNVAPPDQQSEEHFKGDEHLLVENMHPEQPLLEGQLPGVRGRCFITRRIDEGEDFHEIPLRLDTVWLFPHAKRGVAIFHGLTEVAEDDASDVESIIIGAESLDESKPDSHYQEVIAKRLDKKMGGIFSIKDDDLLPTGADYGPALEEDDDDKNEGLLQQNLRRRAEKERKKVRAQIVAMGLDPDEYGPPPLPPEQPLPSLEEIPEFMDHALSKTEEVIEEAKEVYASQGEKTRKLCEEAGVDYDEITKPQGGGGPPPFDAQKMYEEQRAMAETYRGQGLVVTELEKQLDDPDYMKGLKEQEDKVREAYRLSAHHQKPAEKLGSQDAVQMREAVKKVYLHDESFERWDLTGADLSGLDLSGANFKGAFLECADLTDAKLASADFTEAVLTRSTLAGADLTDCCFRKANLGSTDLSGVKLEGVDMREAIVAKSDLSAASLASSQLEGADFYETNFDRTNFEKAQAKHTIFMKLDLRGCVFRGADLSKSLFLETDIGEVDFSGAKLEHTSFIDVRGGGAIFKNARMPNAPFIQGTSLEKADFRGAHLHHANMRGVALAESDFSGAELDGADFSEADLTGANFYRAVAREARFTKANLRDAKLISANLMNAILKKADLRGAQLRGANLYGSDFGKVHSDEATDVGEAYQKRVNIYPLRQP